MNSADEFGHLIRQMSAGQSKEIRTFVYGHVAHYDPILNRVQCVIPSMSGQGGQPIMTPWMPLGSIAAGNGWGIQIAPFGGASFENPTAGEQVAIGVFDREYGTMAAQLMTWNLAAQPPDTGLQPGEMIVKHLSGSFLKFRQDGSVYLTSDADLNVTVGNDATVNVVGNLTANIGGVADITANAGVNITGNVTTKNNLSAGNGGTASFTTPTGQVATFQNGIFVNLV